MKLHEFYQKYANTPLDKRFKILSFKDLGMKTLSDVYRRLKEIEDKSRPDEIERDELLNKVEKFL